MGTIIVGLITISTMCIFLFWCSPNVFAQPFRTATLSQGRSLLVATSVGVGGNMALFAGGLNSVESNVVDIYNVNSNSWSTATLSQARRNFAATSVGNGSIALFAGG